MTDGYRFPIYRANEYNLRKQIMEALEYLGNFPVARTYVSDGEIAYVPAGSQLIVYGGFLIGVGGWLNLEGELIVLGGAYRDEHEHPPYTIDASSGIYEITGMDMFVNGPHRLLTVEGTYAVTGVNAGLDRGYYTPAASGSYSYNGSDAVLTGP